jgi:glycosyltransferase involved in cell wall biosynthesis
MKILILAPYPIFPTHNGGSIRTFHIARSLAEMDCRVTIIGIRPFGSGNHPGPPIHKNLEIVSVKYPFRLPYFLTGRPFPYHFIASFHPGFRFFMGNYLAAFDVYQFEHPNFADLLDLIAPGRPVTYNAHNVEYDYTTSECGAQWTKAVTAKRLYKLEKKLVRRCSAVLACSENDRQRFIELYAAPAEATEVIPNGIREIAATNGAWAMPDPGRFPALSKFRRRALFAGGDSVHNRLAVGFILNELAPRLKNDCGFVIKGNCARRFQRHGLENVFMDVEGGDIAPYARLCTVALNPIIQGGGTNLKLLDYLSHGLPVVSTEFGMRGYGDLRSFVTICDLKDFPGELEKERRFEPRVTNTLEKYLWFNGASKMKSLYSSLVRKTAV